jgi:hypothetical protein
MSRRGGHSKVPHSIAQMKWGQRSWRLASVAVAALCAVSTAGADQVDGAKANCLALEVRGTWWPEDESLAVIVKPEFDREMQGCIRSLIIKRVDSKASGDVLLEKMAEVPMAIWPMGDRLLTLWGSGSALRAVVYASTHGKYAKVLDVRPKGFPEISFSKNGDERLIFTHYEDDEPVSSDVYAWVEGKYRKRSDVPWSRRFDE